jgi:hypothetical protein
MDPTPMPPGYETTDLGIAAALQVAGVQLQGIRREAASVRYRQGRAIFVFNEPDKANSAVQEYYRGALKVDAKGLISTLQEFRRLIFNKEILG